MELDWTAVLNDRATYPDTQTIDLGQGPVTLGALRNAVIPKADFTRQTQHWRGQYEQSVNRQRELEEQLTAVLAQQADPGQQLPPRQESNPQIDYERDPYLAPLYRETRTAAEEARAHKVALARLEQQLTTVTNGLAQLPLVMSLQELQRQNPGMNPQELLAFSQQRRTGQPNLQDDYYLMTRQQRETQIREEATQAALARAKEDFAANPPVPFHPYGPPQTLEIPPAEYETLDAAEQAAMNDPEMHKIFYGT